MFAFLQSRLYWFDFFFREGMVRDLIEKFRRAFAGETGSYEPESILEGSLEEKKNELRRGDYGSREVVVRELYPDLELSKDDMYRELLIRDMDITYNAFNRYISHMEWKDVVVEEEGFYRLTEEGRKEAEEVWSDLS